MADDVEGGDVEGADGEPEQVASDHGAPPVDIQSDAKRRFRDLVRIRMMDRRILTDAEEAALLELALGPLELSLATARGILLHQALEKSVMLESREDRRVMELISAQARADGRDGVLDRRGVRLAMIMAGPSARALGREDRLRAHVSDLADAVGVRAECGVTAPGPRSWNAALPEYLAAEAAADAAGTGVPPAWWAVR